MPQAKKLWEFYHKKILATVTNSICYNYGEHNILPTVKKISFILHINCTCSSALFCFYMLYWFVFSVPSGHILTVQELKVLRKLLAPYTDEKLKELQLLIQEKQEGEISREEVEVLLRQRGLMMNADKLKDDIERGMHIKRTDYSCAVC